jgi:hypothetical protein
MPSKHDMVRGGRKSSMAVTIDKDLESEKWPGKTKDRRVLQNSYRVPSFHKGFRGHAVLGLPASAPGI